MNIFARTLGGVFSDKVAVRGGLKGRVWFLGVVILLEGIALMIFAGMETLFFAVPAMIIFSLFVQMAEGATYGIVPFMNKKALGAVAGIVGAGGNAGAVAGRFPVPRREPDDAGGSFLSGRNGGGLFRPGACGAVLARSTRPGERSPGGCAQREGASGYASGGLGQGARYPGCNGEGAVGTPDRAFLCRLMINAF